jgi:hypothetical protein
MTEISAEDIRKLREKGLLKTRGGRMDPSLFAEVNKEQEEKIESLLHTDKEFLNKDMINHLRSLYDNDKAIFIPGNIPSKKNSKEIMKIYTGRSSCCNATYQKRPKLKPICNQCHKECEYGQRYSIQNSAVVKRYIASSEKDYRKNLPVWQTLIEDLPIPIYVGMYFIRDSMRIFDFNNASQIITDLFKDYGYIFDDNSNVCLPVYLGHHKDPLKTGVIIAILNEDYKTSLINFL